MKIIRRTRIKIKQKDLVIVNNKSLRVCPVCNFPIPQTVQLNENSAKNAADDDKKPTALQTYETTE